MFHMQQNPSFSHDHCECVHWIFKRNYLCYHINCSKRQHNIIRTPAISVRPKLFFNYKSNRRMFVECNTTCAYSLFPLHSLTYWLTLTFALKKKKRDPFGMIYAVIVISASPPCWLKCAQNLSQTAAHWPILGNVCLSAIQIQCIELNFKLSQK